MKLSKLALLAALACGIHAGSAIGGDSWSGDGAAATEIGSGFVVSGYGEPLCGCEAVSGCDGLCGGCATDSCCDLGDPYSLFGEYCGWTAGGWVQMGYHNNDIPLFNRHKNNFNLHQAWLYAEKAIDTSCGFDIGGRIDYVYGVDAQDTQAFGTGDRGWDNSWDNGSYGHALPQAYLEAGYGDLSVKVGHFFTAIGFEGVRAPNNFFYSHAHTMYNSEPFTHTGAVATYAVNKDLSVFGGYTLGWNSGFDDNGDNYLGGFTAALTDDISFTYATTIGRFGEDRFLGVEKGYMHSAVLDVALTDRLQYVFQSDYLDTEDEANDTVRNTIGINQYLIYRINDCLALGSRVEWYEQEGVYSPVGQTDDVYAATFGINYRPHANVLIRPEIRVDHDNAEVIADDFDHSPTQTSFGFDTILMF